MSITIIYQPHSTMSIFSAAANGDLEVLGQCTSLVNKRNSYQQTLLIIAAINGQERAVRLLIALGARLNDQDMYGTTALFFAVVNSKLSIVEILVQAGAIVNISNKNGESDLSFAIRCVKLDYIDILVAAMIRDGVTVLPSIVNVHDLLRFPKVNREWIWQTRVQYLRLVEGSLKAHYLFHESIVHEVCEMMQI